MIQIRPLYEDLGNTRQFYPKTHVRAVIDDTGESIENKLGGQSSYIISQTCSNLSEAINLIPLNKRFPGMSIKYKNSDKLVSWEYLGSDLSNFENLNYWRGTDLTVVLNSNNYVTGNGIHNYVNELISTIMVNPGLEVEEDITETLNGWETNDTSVWTIDCDGGFNGTITCKSSPKYKRVGINLSSIPTDSKIRILFDSNIPYYIKRAAGIGKFSSLGSNTTYNSIEPDLIGDYDSDNLGVFICDETGHYDFVFKKKSNYITIGADSHSSDIDVEWVISNFQIKLITQSSGSGSSLSDVLKRLVFTTGTIPSEYTYERYMDISANSSSGKNGQGSCVYGNYFFAASEANGSSLEVKVYDLENKELILTLTINGVSSNTHVNCLSFGPDNSDIFPYLYIPSGYLVSGSLKVYVYRITGELGTLTATKVYTINLSGFGEWADFFVDSENSRCWVRSSTTFLCYSLPNGDSTLVNNVNTLESFTLPDLTFGYNVTKTSNQGCMYRKGRIWLSSGVPSYSGEGADSCCIIVVNVRSKCRESVIWLKDIGLTNGNSNIYEPEGIFVWNDEIYIPYRTFIAKLIKTDRTSIPSNISAFNNDVGYLTEHLDISDKADKSNTYTKQEVDSAIANVDVSELLNNYYTKLEIDEAGYITDISGKADKSTTYTKSEVDEKITVLNGIILQETSSRANNDNILQAQIDAGIREAEGLVFDTMPTKESANPVLSGGIYTSRRQMLESMAETRVPSATSWPSATYSLTEINISEEGLISAVTSSSKSNYHVVIYTVTKDTIIHWTAGLKNDTSTASAFQRFGFLSVLPSTVDAANLVGVQTEYSESHLATHEVDIDIITIAPYDGYLLRYYYSEGGSGSRWDSNKSSCKIYPPLPVRNSDEEPTVNSQNWITSGGVFEEFYKDRTEGKTLISTAMAQQNKFALSGGVVNTTTNAYIMLPYYPCVKGECFILKYKATTTGANNSTLVFAVWTPSKPIAGVSYTTLHYKTVTDTDEHEIRLVAPDDGYIAVRWKWKEGTNDDSNLSNIRLCKWYDTSVVEPYVYKGLLSVNYASSNRSRVINADSTSQDFGNIITVSTNTNVGISDFIDVEGLSWLKMYNLFVISASYYDKVSGSVFYDIDYNPLSVACYVQFNGNTGYGTILVKVPENAKYLRLTGYQLTSDTWLPRCQYLEAWTTEKFNEKISIESTPKQDSTKLVESGGIFSAVDSLTNTLKSVIPTDGYFGASNPDKCSVSEQYVTFSKAEPIIYNVGDISNAENYRIKYIKQAHSKGTIVRIDATGSYSLNITVGFSRIDPAVYLEENGSLVGLEVQEPYSSNGINHFFNVVYPFDGWLVYRYYSTGSTWSRFYFTVYDGKDLSNVIDELMNYKEINIESIPERTYYINPETLKYGSNKNYKHALLDLEGITRLKITSNDKTSAQLAWLTNGNPSSSGGTPPILDGMVHVFSGTRVFLIPDGAMYAYIYKSSNNWASPKYIGIRRPSESVSIDMTETFANEDIQGRKTEYSARAANMHLMPLNVPVDSNGWELPESVQMQNVLKKALQMINIRWTPKHNFPLSLGAYAQAGTAFTHGIPYTNNNSRFKRVGLEVSLHTFMTAINNPYSLCYTEQVDDVNHHSSWGEDYWATNGNGYYGTVCCAFTSAVLGIKFNVGNNNHYKSSKVLGLFTTLCKPLTQQNINYLRIGDIADDAKHSGLVFGLKRDANGNVTRVKWAEATGSSGGSIMGCHISDWTADYFINYINTHNTSGMTMFRYTGLYDNIDYETSPYVPLTDYGESSDGVVYNNDICTFAGDKATFMKGNLVVLNYNLDSNSIYNWTGIEVYKDDVLLETYTLSQAEQSLTDFYANDGEPITPDPYNDGLSQSNHALVLGKSLDAGKYKARMINGSSHSDYTYWEVLNDTVTLTFNDNGSVSVDGGSNGKIAYIMIGYISDTNPNYMYHGFWHNNVCLPPTIFEEISNKITFYPKEFREKYNFIGSTSHIVVMKEGEYGLASTMPIAVSAPSGDEEPDDDGD